MTLYKVWFIRDSRLFKVQFRQVYTGFPFVQGPVQTRLYRITVCSRSSLDRFTQDSHLYVQFKTGLYRIPVCSRSSLRQVYTGFPFVQGPVQTGLYRIPVCSRSSLDRFIQDYHLFKVQFKTGFTVLYLYTNK